MTATSARRRRDLVAGSAAGLALLLAVPAACQASPLSNSSSGFSLGDILGHLPGVDGPTAPRNGQTRCETVIQVGDSTSEIADDAAALGAEATASAQYRRVGVENVTVDALRSRAIVRGPSPDADTVVADRLAAGERGCWVIAMGVNDAGAIADGGMSADQRIDRVMGRLTGQDVLWPTIMTSSPANPAFGPDSMRAFNDALRRAENRYGNLSVYDWAGQARPAMYTDGIHYTTAATAQRNRAFADGLAQAYPATAGS